MSGDKKVMLWIWLLLLGLGQLRAQDSTEVRRNRFVGLPIAFFSPETKFGGGVAGIYSFRLPKTADDSRPSQLQFGLTYTQERQILAYLPFEIRTAEQEWLFFGELGYYRYFYQFWGVGNTLSDANEETYSVNFPRLRLNVLRKVLPNTFLGLRYWADDYQVGEVAEGGLLASGDIPGAEGGLVSGLGVLSIYDNRDQIFYPSRGWLVEGLILQNGPALGSPYRFTRARLDASRYLPVWRDHILALNFLGEFVYGDVPFQELALYGGTKKARGFYQGRYRDKKMLLLQAAYRFPIYWRFRGELFASYGGVGPRLSELKINEFHLNYGAGLRFALNPEEKIHVRLDVGIGNGQPNFYLTIGEAF
ncbi:MAG: BamA/TamA family outer membrane protein [Bacteroidia bacterium]